MASGASVTFWSVPVERIVDLSVGPLTHDHLLDFHHKLQDDEAIAAALGALVDD